MGVTGSIFFIVIALIVIGLLWPVLPGIFDELADHFNNKNNNLKDDEDGK